MDVTVFPSAIGGRVVAPPSKSATIRALAAALLAPGRSVLRRPSLCDDALAARRVVGALGAAVRDVPQGWEVDGGFAPDGAPLACGESGLVARMFPPVAALSSREIRLEGEGSLLRRPLAGLEGVLGQLGVAVASRGGFLPVTVRGPLLGGRATVDGTVSSQFLTGLLTALPLAPADSQIEVVGLASRPYIDLTLEVLGAFDVRVEHEDYRAFYIAGGQEYLARDFAVEGDWSGAAFLLVAGALVGQVTVGGVDASSRQPDRAVLDVVGRFGAEVEHLPEGVRVSPGDRRPFEFDAASCPDLFPPLVALAAHAAGESVLFGAGRLRHKESDRAAALVEMFGRLGVRVEVEGDRMTVRGGRVCGGAADACGDHRMAMAAAVAALAGGGPVRIRGAGCVAKSYPDFFADLRALGTLYSSAGTL